MKKYIFLLLCFFSISILAQTSIPRVMRYKGVIYANCTGSTEMLTCIVRGAKPIDATPLSSYNFRMHDGKWYYCGEGGKLCTIVTLPSGDPDPAYEADEVRMN